MANREIGFAPLVVYLAAWWGFVVALVLWLTSNSAPGAPEIGFKEPSYYVTSKIGVSITKDAVDPDGDLVEYEYSWTKDGEPVEDLEGPTLPPGAVRAGQVWKVTVTPDDGSKGSFGCGMLPAWRTCAGETTATAEITIANTPPSARVRVVDASGKDVLGLTGADLKLQLSCYDPDLIQKDRDAVSAAGGNPSAPPVEGAAPKADPCTYKVAWYAGAAPALTAADPKAAAPAEGATPADAAAPAAAPAEIPQPKFTDVLELSGSQLRGSKVWRIHVIANDGELDGSISEVVLEPPPA